MYESTGKLQQERGGMSISTHIFIYVEKNQPVFDLDSKAYCGSEIEKPTLIID